MKIKLTKKEESVLRALAAGDYIKADWKPNSARGGFFLSGNGESVHKKTYISLKNKNLIAGVTISMLGKEWIKMKKVMT